jgi:hypothetical protein
VGRDLLTALDGAVTRAAKTALAALTAREQSELNRLLDAVRAAGDRER